MKEHPSDQGSEVLLEKKEAEGGNPLLKPYQPPELRKHPSYKEITNWMIIPPTPIPTLS